MLKTPFVIRGETITRQFSVILFASICWLISRLHKALSWHKHIKYVENINKIWIFATQLTRTPPSFSFRHGHKNYKHFFLNLLNKTTNLALDQDGKLFLTVSCPLKLTTWHLFWYKTFGKLNNMFSVERLMNNLYLWWLKRSILTL